MRTFLTVLKSDLRRTMPRIVPVFIYTLVTLGTILLAVYITGTQQVKARIAFIPYSSSESAPRSEKALSVSVTLQKPPRSALIEQKYDAFVTARTDGGYEIETLRNDKYRDMLELLLTHPGADVSAYRKDRGVGVNIIGFMTMFLLMGACANLFAFADDKEQGQLRRIAAAPVSFGTYLAAHCAYCLCLTIPEYLLIVILKLCGWNIGFSLAQYAGLMTVLSFLGISLALLLNTLIKKPDNASMLGNSICILTSVLAGSFYSLSDNNAVLESIVGVLPQKQLLDFAESLQNGAATEHAGALLYVIAFSAVLFLASCAMLKRQYVHKV